MNQLPAERTPSPFLNSSPGGYVTALSLLVIVSVGAALRFHLLGVRGFSDEAARWTFASLPWVSFWKEIWRDEANMAFYYLLLRGWLVLGDSEWIIRSLSVLIGLSTLPALYLLGSRLFGRQVGLTSAALLAVHSFHIRYSQEARGYVLLAFLLVLSTYFFVKAIESPGQYRFLAAYLLTSVLACYCHFFAPLALAAQWLSLDLPKLRRLGALRIVVLLSIFVFLTAPLAAFVFFQSRSQIRVQLNWIPRLTWGDFVGFAYFFTGDARNVLLILYLVFCCISLLGLIRRKSLPSFVGDTGWYLKLIALWLALPLGVIIGGSFIKPLFQPRYLLMCLPALILCAGLGLTKLSRCSFRGRRLLWLYFMVLISMLALSVWSARKQYRSAASARNAFRAMTQYILNHQQPEDAIFFCHSQVYMPFNYYAHRLMEEHGEMPVPSIVFPLIGEVPPGEKSVPTRDLVESAVRGRERVWVIAGFGRGANSELSTISRMVRATIEEQFQVRDQQVFRLPGTSVTLYARVRRPGEPGSN